jgi:hypothetical protein
MPVASPAPPSAAPTLESWRRARQKLDSIRQAAEGEGPRTLRIALKLREPHTGKVMEARGAVAIAPPRTLRMILLGPGGTTALDLWAKDDRFRFAIPALDVLKRGNASTPRASLRGLPVDFLRWWLLRPASGRLLWHVSEQGADRFVLRDGEGIIDLRAGPRGELHARRTTWAVLPGAPMGAPPSFIDEEQVWARRIGCADVHYQQASTGLDITVTCEGEETERPPNPRAFTDPDAPQYDSEDGGEGS